jgi:hypothetical protein
MERTTMNQLKDIIFKLDSDDISIAFSMLKDRRKSIGREIKYSLRVGDVITVDDLGEGTITKINRTRCVAMFDKGSYNVPFSLINQGE